jgi:hypothetical protein
MADVASLAGFSDMSDTDRVVFTVLSNPERIDLSAFPRTETSRMGGGGESCIEELPPIDEEGLHTRQCDADDDCGAPSGLGGWADATTSLPRRSSPSPVPPSPRSAAGYDAYDDARRAQRSEAAEDHGCRDRGDDGESDDEDAKRTLLLDLRGLQLQGVQLSKTDWSMNDSVDDMTLEIRRATLAMDELSNVNMMRDGLRLAVTAIEMVNNRIGLLDLEGWSSEVCRDLHKQDHNLSRIYRKYWRRSTSNSPELDICMSLVGSMGFHHMKRMMSKQLMAGAAGGRGGGVGNGFSAGFARASAPRAGARAASPLSSDDEEPPR